MHYLLSGLESFRSIYRTNHNEQFSQWIIKLNSLWLLRALAWDLNC